MSSQNLTSLILRENDFVRLRLAEAEILRDRQINESINLDELWTGFNFLKALGFKEILFRHPSRDQLESWLIRVEGYQQVYIQDPEYAGFDEFIWNEPSPDSEEAKIECFRELTTETEILGDVVEVVRLDLGPVPPMHANLSIDEKSIQAFRQEIEFSSVEDQLHRFEHIFEEYKILHGTDLHSDALNMLGGVIKIALENRKIDKALNLARQHHREFKQLLNDDLWLARLLEAFEPKAAEIQPWSSIFDELSTERLITLLTQQLGTVASRQLAKLTSIRATRDVDTMIQICVSSPLKTQKILAQWLAPHWRPKHYAVIQQQLENALRQRDPDCIQPWLQALLRSYLAKALEDLKTHFQPKKIWQSLFSKKTSDQKMQEQILLALEELRSVEILNFLKDVRPHVQGRPAHQIEKMIGQFKEKRVS